MLRMESFKNKFAEADTALKTRVTCSQCKRNTWGSWGNNTLFWLDLSGLKASYYHV